MDDKVKTIDTRQHGGLRLRSGRLLPFLLEVAAKKHKAQRKQAEDQSVFLGFGDDGTVNSETESVGRTREKSAGLGRRRQAAEGSGSEVADGLFQQAGAPPPHRFRRRPAVSEGSADAGADSVGGRVQKHMRDGLGVGADAKRGGVGGGGGKGLRSSAAGNSSSDGIIVFGIVGAGGGGGEGSQSEDGVAGRVDVGKGRGGEPGGVLIIVGVAGRSSDGTFRVVGAAKENEFCIGNGGAAKNPESVRGGVVLAGIDINVNLRLALVKRRHKEQGGR